MVRWQWAWQLVAVGSLPPTQNLGRGSSLSNKQEAGYSFIFSFIVNIKLHFVSNSINPHAI